MLLLLLLAGCATNPALEEARSLAVEGRFDDGVMRLEQAMREDPGNKEVRAQYFRQRELVVAQLLTRADAQAGAGQYDAAADLYGRARRLDANNPRVQAGLATSAARQRQELRLRQAQELLARDAVAEAQRIVHEVLVDNPIHPQARQLASRLRERTQAAQVPARSLAAAYARPITLEFRDSPMKSVFEVIARTSGINFVFDKDVRTDTRVTIFVRETGIDEVVRLVLATNRLAWKLLNPNSVLIYPDTQAKARDYAELVTRSFYLANTDVKQAQALVRTLVRTRDVFIDEKLNLLVLKDTPDAVHLAERLLASLDKAEPEVMLDVEVLELTRSKLQELGLRFPDQIGYGALQPSTASTTILNNGVTQTHIQPGGTLAPGSIDPRNRAGLSTFAANPLLLLNLSSQGGDGNLLANPRIRVKNREKARIHIGEKLPVFTTTSSANVGVSASVSYLDVGLKLEVEPNVSLEGEVAIRMGLEVSSIVREVPGPSNSLAYQVGTRSVATVLRLRDGETQVLAGLISDEERSSANRLPGLGDIPVLGRLFSNQRDSRSKTEIVLLITPRIVRALVRPDAAELTIPAGSESAVGVPALRLRGAGPRALSLSSSAPAGPRTDNFLAPVPAAEATDAPKAGPTDAPATEAASTPARNARAVPRTLPPRAGGNVGARDVLDAAPAPEPSVDVNAPPVIEVPAPTLRPSGAK